MNRSEFLKSLGLGLGGLVLPKTSFINSQCIKIYDNYIRGLHYYKFKKIKQLLKEKDTLTLVRNRENVHDLYAIEVYFQNYKLGYIPAYENVVLANLMDQNVALFAQVSKLDPKNYFQGIAVEVFTELIVPSEKLFTMMDHEPRADDATDLYRGFKR